MMPSRAHSHLLHAIFLVSGLCGLGYQLIWSRLFVTGLGHEFSSVLAAIAAFFGGFAIGAWLLDRRIAQSRNPGRWYGWLEVTMGVWGLLSAYAIPEFNQWVLDWTGIGASSARRWAISLLVPSLVLLPSTAAMGAALPAMERILLQRDSARQAIPSLYSANTFGAMLGVLLTTWFLIPNLGLQRSLMTFSLINITCGVAVLWGTRRWRAIEPFSRTRPQLNGPAWQTRGAMAWMGMLGIAFELAGVRVLSEVVENTIYSFAASLLVFLLGNSLGAGLTHRLVQTGRPAALLNWVVLGLMASGVAGIWALSQAGNLYGGLREIFGDALLGVVMAEIITSTTVFLLPALFMGAAFTIVLESAHDRMGGIGRALAFNAIGCALASAIIGGGVLLVAGAKWTLAAVVSGYALLLLWRTSWPRVAAIGLAAPLLVLPLDLRHVAAPPRGKILDYRLSTFGSVAVAEHMDGNRSLIVNSRYTMGGTGAAAAAQRHAHIPLLLHRDPKRALFLGLGTGITFAAANSYPGLAADGVELIPEVVNVWHYFAPHNMLRDGLRVHIADARRFARVSDSTYDVIVADLFHPARDGAGALYSREHFQALGERLGPGGLICQWLPLYQLDEAVLKVIVRTFMDVFPHTQAFLLRLNVDTPVLGLIATQERTHFSTDGMEQRLSPALSSALKSVQLADRFQLFGCFLASASELREFAGLSARNTDDRPVVTFEAPKASFRRETPPYELLVTLLNRFHPSPADLIDPSETEFIERLRRYLEARNAYFKALIAENRGQAAEVIREIVTSAQISPDFSTAYAHGLTLAAQLRKASPEASQKLLRELDDAQPARGVARELMKRLF